MRNPPTSLSRRICIIDIGVPQAKSGLQAEVGRGFVASEDEVGFHFQNCTENRSKVHEDCKISQDWTYFMTKLQDFAGTCSS